MSESRFTTQGSQQLEHVIYIMLENRGFDHLLGWMYQGGEDIPAAYVPSDAGDEVKFYALAADFLEQQGICAADLENAVTSGTQTLYSRGPSGVTTRPLAGASTPSVDPYEEFEHVNMQLYGSQENPSSHSDHASMTGFMQDFAGRFGESGTDWSDYQGRIQSIMHCYGPADVPVLNNLGRFYAVCDQWFSSVPTQTNANRGFSLAGHSISKASGELVAIVNNTGSLAEDVFTTVDVDGFSTSSIFKVLNDNDVSWKTYYQVKYPIPDLPPKVQELGLFLSLLFPGIDSIIQSQETCYTESSFPDAAGGSDRFVPFTNLLDDIKGGTLPTFAYVEPSWTFEAQVTGAVSSAAEKIVQAAANLITQVGQDSLGLAGNDYHPPVDMTAGELFLQTIYAALVANPDLFSKTLLVVTFDEHGGTYDHVMPKTNATPPWGDVVPSNVSLQNDFTFRRFGVRVPTLFISPWISEKTVIRSETSVPFDHTSVLSTLLSWQGIAYASKDDPGYMGERVANAPTFLDVLNADVARSDDLFAGAPAPAEGSEVQFGQELQLVNQAGKAITAAYSGVRYWYPTNGNPSDAVGLSFYGGVGPVDSSSPLFLRTSEHLNASNTLKSSSSSGLGPYVYSPPANMLGAWSDEHDCYYYQSIDDDKQLWKIVPTDGSTSVTYAATVKIVSASTEYEGEALEVNGDYLTTTSGDGDTWTVVAAPQPIASTD